MSGIFMMMIGIAGSGKSYHAAQLAKESNAIIVSSDAIRGELFGDENDQNHNAQVFEEVHRRVLAALREGRNVIYDATNLSAKRRKAFLTQVPAGVFKSAYLIATDYDLILKQNASRERKVPEDVIRSMYLRLQMPRKSEGWDRIVFIRNDRNTSTIESAMRACVGFDQDNPHHSALLDDHMKQAEEYVACHAEEYGINGYNYLITKTAAKYHDIGKPDCKTYKLWSGKIDDHAHYYGHADVGAYIAACVECPFGNDIVDRMCWKLVIMMIQYHMDCYADKNWLDKIEKVEGYEFRRMMELLHEGDKNGH